MVQLLVRNLVFRSSLVVQMVKSSLALQKSWVQSWVRKIPWRRKWQATRVLLPGKFHGWRSLVSESDTTEQLHFTSYFISKLLMLLLSYSRSVVSNFLQPHAARQSFTLSFTISWNLLKLMSIELVMPSNHLLLCLPSFLLPSVFPIIGVFSN